MTGNDAVATRDYHGTTLYKPEWEAMMAIERALGDKAVPMVDKIESDTFGYVAAGGHVTGLGLYNKRLSSLPETIGELKSLTYLHLNSNKLQSLPDSIGIVVPAARSRHGAAGPAWRDRARFLASRLERGHAVADRG